jgi:cysteinyl-tRNA synthetase
VAALDDDLDLPTALAVVREVVRSDLPPDERRWLALDADFVLGLDLGRVAAAPAKDTLPRDVTRIAERRAAARAERDFATSDALRDELGALGYEVTDGRDGQTVRRR